MENSDTVTELLLKLEGLNERCLEEVVRVGWFDAIVGVVIMSVCSILAVILWRKIGGRDEDPARIIAMCVLGIIGFLGFICCCCGISELLSPQLSVLEDLFRPRK